MITAMPGEFLNTPVLNTERLTLVPFTERHLTERYVRWLNDPVVVRFSENRHRRHDLNSCRAYLNSMSAGGHLFWAMLDQAANQCHIGNLTAYIDYSNRTADLAIMIGERAAMGKKFGAEAWLAACDWLLKVGNMRKITAGTMSNNRPMLSIMREAGMVEEGRRLRQFIFEGAETDLVLAGLSAHDRNGTN